MFNIPCSPQRAGQGKEWVVGMEHMPQIFFKSCSAQYIWSRKHPQQIEGVCSRMWQTFWVTGYIQNWVKLSWVATEIEFTAVREIHRHKQHRTVSQDQMFSEPSSYSTSCMSPSQNNIHCHVIRAQIRPKGVSFLEVWTEKCHKGFHSKLKWQTCWARLWSFVCQCEIHSRCMNFRILTHLNKE